MLSISKDLTKAIDCAQSITTMEKRVIKTMQHACKSLRFDKDNVWVKKDDPEFDVTISSYDSVVYTFQISSNKISAYIV